MATPVLRLVHGYKPHEAVVLGIDPATKSGWALFARGKLLANGVAVTAADRFEVLELLAAVAADEGLPIAVVVEDWSPGDWKSWKAIAVTHASWGRWSEQLELVGLLEQTVRVLVNTWRRDVYGRGSASMPRKMAKQMAKQRVRATYQKDVCDDRAEAILIGEWGCRAGEVAGVLAA